MRISDIRAITRIRIQQQIHGLSRCTIRNYERDSRSVDNLVDSQTSTRLPAARAIYLLSLKKVERSRTSAAYLVLLRLEFTAVRNFGAHDELSRFVLTAR